MIFYFVTSQELDEAIERAVEGVLSATQELFDGLQKRVKKLEKKEIERAVEAELKKRLEEKRGD